MHLDHVDQGSDSSIKTSAILKAHKQEVRPGFGGGGLGAGTCRRYGNRGLTFSSSIHFSC